MSMEYAKEQEKKALELASKQNPDGGNGGNEPGGQKSSSGDTGSGSDDE